MSLRIALFVEGSQGDEELHRLWRFLASKVDVNIDQIIGISKPTLTAMDPDIVQLSGQAVPLDDGWARYLFAELWTDSKANEAILANPTWVRWMEVTRLCPERDDP